MALSSRMQSCESWVSASSSIVVPEGVGVTETTSTGSMATLKSKMRGMEFVQWWSFILGPRCVGIPTEARGNITRPCLANNFSLVALTILGSAFVSCLKRVDATSVTFSSMAVSSAGEVICELMSISRSIREVLAALTVCSSVCCLFWSILDDGCVFFASLALELNCGLGWASKPSGNSLSPGTLLKGGRTTNSFVIIIEEKNKATLLLKLVTWIAKVGIFLKLRGKLLTSLLPKLKLSSRK